jgi:hypothetical protein
MYKLELLIRTETIHCRYYSDMEKQVCLTQQASKQTPGKNLSDIPHPDACFIWRRFAKYVKCSSHLTKCYKVYNYLKLLSILTFV